MQLTRQDIDQLVRKFKIEPSEYIYNTVKNWYEENIHYYNDVEYMICIYIFLLGANIKQRYTTFTFDEHKNFIKEIRDLIENADSLVKGQRKTYLDYGTK